MGLPTSWRMARVIGGVGAAAFLAACTSPTYNTAQREVPAFGAGTVTAESPVASNRAHVLVYRPASVQGAEPVNVYVNDRFVTSLLPGAFVQVTVCAANAKIAAVQADARQSAHTGRLQAVALPLALGKRSYFEVTPGAADANGVRLQAVDGITSNAGALRQQAHALNRSVTC